MQHELIANQIWQYVDNRKQLSWWKIVRVNDTTITLQRVHLTTDDNDDEFFYKKHLMDKHEWSLYEGDIYDKLEEILTR